MPCLANVPAIMEPVPPPLPPNLPPPIPPSLPAADRRGIIFEGRVVPGTENLTATDIAEEVLAGGRFVFFQYCISVILMTFRRPTEMVFLKQGEDAGKHALGWSLLTLFAGWWGFPWGPIYTIGALVTNMSGGKDVTREILAGLLPSAAIDPLMKQRARPKTGPLLWILRTMIIGFPIALVGMFTWLGAVGAAQEAKQKKLPGYAEFTAANDAIEQRSENIAGGNTPEARTIADEFRRSMESGREALFVRKGGSSRNSSRDLFHTWCELRPGSCVMLVQVPDLRKYDTEAKGIMCDLAWEMAQAAAEKHLAAKDGTTLAVGVRGYALYESLMTGKLGEGTADETPAASIKDHTEAREKLIQLFASPAPAK